MRKRTKALLAALLILWTVLLASPIQFAHVQGGSMRPTLATGDLVLALGPEAGSP